MIPAAVAVVTGIPTRDSAPRPRTIHEIVYLDSYGATDAVKLWRNKPADVQLRGQFLDLSTGVEIRTQAGGQVLTFAGKITQRQGGDDTRITVNFDQSTITALGTYQVLIHYLVETSGPDKFNVRVFDRGTVTQIRIAESAEADGSYLTGKDYTLVVKGDHLDNAQLFKAKTGIAQLTLLAPPSPGTPSSTEQRFGIRFGANGVFTIDAQDFFDKNLPAEPPVDCPVQCYDGTTSFAFKVATVPLFGSVNARTPNAGTPVTISGTSLNVPGMTMTLRGRRRYGPPSDFSGSVSPLGSNLVFTASPDMLQDSVRVEYRPSTSPSAPPTFTVNLPTIAVQGGTPEAVLLDTLAPVGGGTAFTRRFVVSGRRTIVGRFLAPNNLLSFTLAAPPTQINRSIPTTPIAPSGPLSSPVIKFGQNPLDVASATYNPTAPFRTTLVGADFVAFDMIGFSDTLSKDLTVTTPFGTATIQNVLFVPTPNVTAIRRRLPNGQTIDALGKLFKGDTYEISGVGIILASSGKVIHSGTVRLGGAQLTVLPPTATPQSTLVFTVPQNAASGPVTVQTVAGTSAPVSMTVENPPSAISIAGFQLSPNPVVGGQSVTGTVAIDATIPPNTSIGSLAISASPNSASAVTLPGTRPVNANPVTFTVGTHVVRSPITASISVADINSTSGGRSATVQILPPSPTSVTFSNPTVLGGSPATATIQMSGAATPADSIIISLASADPTTATVPATVVLNGSTAVVQVPTQVVPTARTVTINATSGGQTRSATLTVNPPSVATVTPQTASVIGTGGGVPVAITLNAPLSVPQTATISCDGEGLRCGTTTITVSGSSGSFVVTAQSVPTARTTTITVTMNGIARSGTLQILPVGLSSMVALPTSVRAGAASSITFQLNQQSALTFQLSSSDSTVIVPPLQVVFNGGTTTQLLSIPTRSPQTQTKTVTITATATLQTSFGSAISTKTATITVTP